MRWKWMLKKVTLKQMALEQMLWLFIRKMLRIHGLLVMVWLHMESTQPRFWASDANIVSIAIAEAGIADDLKNCALYEKPVSSDLSLTEEINPRLCAVSTNPVDEDDGQLSLPGSAKEDEVMRSPWFNKKYMDVLLSDSWWIDVNDEFMELDSLADACDNETADTLNAVVETVETDGQVKGECSIESEDTEEAYDEGKQSREAGSVSTIRPCWIDCL
ncbi:hypothetical protein EB796_006424 [Bugula neritina]|uniref:Uncharacterized protein n=1 Tax=Bugula neritina TaxID=10212 RepID=A0A7J7K9F0_BUGNE|nr:hypothetical protein EB796_006424 [Bugula neritina]